MRDSLGNSSIALCEPLKPGKAAANPDSMRSVKGGGGWESWSPRESRLPPSSSSPRFISPKKQLCLLAVSRHRSTRCGIAAYSPSSCSTKAVKPRPAFDARSLVAELSLGISGGLGE